MQPERTMISRSVTVKPTFVRTRNDEVFQGRTLARSRLRPVRVAAATIACAASVA